MNSLDYFWLADGEEIYIARCHLASGEIIGRRTYFRSASGHLRLGQHTYAKDLLYSPGNDENPGVVCNIPGDTCIAIPMERIAGILSPRVEFPRLRRNLPAAVSEFLDEFTAGSGILQSSIGLIGSDLFDAKPGRSVREIDLAIYGTQNIHRAREFVRPLADQGLVTKLPLENDEADSFRMQHYEINVVQMERIRRNQWFRNLIWKGFDPLVSLCFAPEDEYMIALDFIGQDIDTTATVVGNEESYYPPFSYDLADEDLVGIKRCSSFAWSLRHAFDLGDVVAIRGTLVEIDGRKSILIWRKSHYLRPASLETR